MVALILYASCWFIYYSYAIRLNRNGYEDVTVYIGDNVPEGSVSLQEIQDWLTESSKTLYIASRYHVFLRNITIRVPKSWSSKPFYETVSGSGGSSSNIIIDEANPLLGNKPYTFGQTMCGKEALYTHYTPDVIKQGNTGIFGNLGKVFTHEWGHLRWGLFDEYASVKDHFGIPIEFYLQKGNWEPVRCTLDVKGQNWKWNDQKCRLDNRGKPETGCRFRPYRDHRATAKGSIMGHTFIPSIEEFCDSKDDQQSPKHNSLAPNLQNIRCGGKSAWDVLRDHADIKDSNSGDPLIDTTPFFSYIQPNDVDKISLVMDTSGSMSGLIGLARNAAISLIKLIIPDGAYLSIVTFASSAQLKKNLTKITSEDDRQNLVKALPKFAGGGTSIGSGLEMAMEDFRNRQQGSSIKGNIIYLTSDGQDGSTLLQRILPDIIDSGVIVHTLAIGKNADQRLSEIAKATGGSNYFVSSQNTLNSTSLLDSLSEPFTQGKSNTIVKVQSTPVTATNDAPFEDSFSIDDSIGNDTVIQYTGETLIGVRLTVTTPTGENFTRIGNHSDQGVISVKLPGRAKVGQYKIRLSSNNGNTLQGTLGVQSKPSDPNEEIINIKAWTADSNVTYSATMQYPVYVSVLKGHMPVSNADVTVTIENKDGNGTTLKLLDNAIGADTIKNDGIYSAFILSKFIKSGGRHSIKAQVEGVNASITVPVSKAASPSDEDDSVKEKPLQNFQRTRIGQTFNVEQYKEPSSPNIDQIPPSPIQTLMLEKIDDENKQYILSWNAVGDDFDSGKAQSYDIRIAKDHNGLVSNPDKQETLPNKLTPKSPGEVERFTVDLNGRDIENTTYYVAVRAKDDKDLMGNISNPVSISILVEKSWTAPLKSEPVVNTSHENLLMGVVVVIVGIVVIALVVVVGIFANSFFRWKTIKEKQGLKV